VDFGRYLVDIWWTFGGYLVDICGLVGTFLYSPFYRFVQTAVLCELAPWILVDIWWIFGGYLYVLTFRRNVLLPSSVLRLTSLKRRSIATKPWDLEPRFSPVMNLLNNAISTLPNAKLFLKTHTPS
jgi:hypothetical protein